MSAGHFSGNLLFRINFRAGFSRHSRLVSPRCYFSSIFCFLFFFQQSRHDILQTGFNKTFCICHRKGAAKPEESANLVLWQESTVLRNMTGTIARGASEESALYLLLRKVFFFFFFFCYSQIFLSAYLGLRHLSRLLPPSHFLISSPRALWCAVKVNLGLMSGPLMSMQHTANDNKTNSAFFFPAQRHQFTLILIWQ